MGHGRPPRAGRRNLPQDLISSNPRATWDSMSGHHRNQNLGQAHWPRGPQGHAALSRSVLPGKKAGGPLPDPGLSVDSPPARGSAWTFLGVGDRECHPNTTPFLFLKLQGSFPSESEGGGAGDCVALGDSAPGRALPVQAWWGTGWPARRGEGGGWGSGARAAQEAARRAARTWSPRISPSARGHPPVR